MEEEKPKTLLQQKRGAGLKLEKISHADQTGETFAKPPVIG